MVESASVQPVGVSLEAVSFFLLVISVFLFFIWRNLSAIKKALESRQDGVPIAASVVLPDGAVHVTVVSPSADEAAAVSRTALASLHGSGDIGGILTIVEQRRDVLKAYQQAKPGDVDKMRYEDWAELAALVAKARVLYPDVGPDAFDRASEAVTGFPVAIRDAARAGLSDVPSGDPRVATIESQYATYWSSLRWLEESMAAALLRPPS